jgi:hypothetical protein
MKHKYRPRKDGGADLSIKKNRDQHEQELIKPEELRQNIEELEKLDLSTVTDAQLRQLIDTKIAIVMFADAKTPAGSDIYRARINKEGKAFTTFSEITAPAARFIKTYGRANKPGERIFYGAYNGFIAAAELILNPETIEEHEGTISLTVGQYRVIEDLHLVPILHDKKLQEVRKDIKKSIEGQSNLKNLYSKDAAESHDLIIEFFAKQVTKNKIKILMTTE